MGNSSTDSNGYYEIGPITNDDGPFQGTLDVYIRFLASSTNRQVNDASDNVYDGYSCTLSNVTDGDIWFPQNCTGDDYYTPPDSEIKAWWIYYTLYDGYNYLWNNGYVMDKATARWAEGHDANYQLGDDGGTHYHRGGQIHLDGLTHFGSVGGHANDPDVILHEYGHNVMWYFYNDFPTTNCPDPHNWFSNEAINCAWTEGWAGFYPTAVYNDGTFSDTTQDFEIYSETNTDSIGYVWDTGDDVEGRVTGALYDIYDSDNDGYDNFSDGFNNIWDVFL